MPSVDLEKIWLAASAERLSAPYYERDEFVPEEIEAQYMENIGAVEEAAEEIRSRLGELAMSPNTAGIIEATLLSTETREEEDRIFARAEAAVVERQEDLEEGLDFLEPLEIVADPNEVFLRLQCGRASERSMAQVLIVERYGRFVRKKANEMIRRLPNVPGVDFDDLLQEGLIALLHSADSHSIEKGNTFLTYANKAIHWRMRRHYEDMESTVRLPVTMRSKLGKMLAVNNKRISRRERQLTLEEIAEITEVTPSLSIDRTNRDTTVGNILEAHLIADLMGSIDTGYSPRELGPKNDYVVDEANPLENLTQIQPNRATDDEALKAMLVEDVKQALTTLNYKEREVLELRFGLADGRLRTLEEVGNIFGITRETVRQTEARALAKLRRSQARGEIHLVDYLETS